MKHVVFYPCTLLKLIHITKDILIFPFNIIYCNLVITHYIDLLQYDFKIRVTLYFVYLDMTNRRGNLKRKGNDVHWGAVQSRSCTDIA